VGNPLQYAARHYEPHSKMYQMRARWYDPQLGRFLSEDPIGLEGGINPYAYAGNDPANHRDPTGLYRDCGIKVPDGDDLWSVGVTVGCKQAWGEIGPPGAFGRRAAEIGQSLSGAILRTLGETRTGAGQSRATSAVRETKEPPKSCGRAALILGVSAVGDYLFFSGVTTTFVAWRAAGSVSGALAADVLTTAGTRGAEKLSRLSV
jgi:RHS repeat-associated protein